MERETGGGPAPSAGSDWLRGRAGVPERGRSCRRSGGNHGTRPASPGGGCRTAVWTPQAGGGRKGRGEGRRWRRRRGRGETPSCGGTAPTSAGAASGEAAPSSCWREPRLLPPSRRQLPLPPRSARRRRRRGTSGGCRRSGGRSRTWPGPGARGGPAGGRRRTRCGRRRRSARAAWAPTGPAGAGGRPLLVWPPVSTLGSPCGRDGTLTKTAGATAATFIYLFVCLFTQLYRKSGAFPELSEGAARFPRQIYLESESG